MSPGGFAALVAVSSETVTSTAPVPAGLIAVNVVELLTVTLDAGAVPKKTAAPAANPLPVTVTVVPPALGPAAGLIELTDGDQVMTKP